MKPHSPSTKSLGWVWFVLVALHFSILGTAMLPLRFFKTPVILIMVLIQTILVMQIFMEVRYAAKLIRLFAAAGFFWLLIQFTLVAADYLTRLWH